MSDLDDGRLQASEECRADTAQMVSRPDQHVAARYRSWSPAFDPKSIMHTDREHVSRLNAVEQAAGKGEYR